MCSWSKRAMRRLARSLTMAAVSVGLSNAARAGFSPVYSPPLPGNVTQPSIFDNIYGGAFTLGSNGVDYSNGTLTAVRVSDYLPSSSSSDNPGPDGTDQLWQDSSVQASVKFSNAEFPSSPFGYIPGASGGSFTPLFGITGSGYSVTGSSDFSPGSGVFRFAAEYPFGVMSSMPSDNRDGKDHMITYEMNGLGGSDETWLLLFGDFGSSGANSYFDYQNLVVQLKTTPSGSSSVPEPGSLMLVAGGALGLFKRVRRRLL